MMLRRLTGLLPIVLLLSAGCNINVPSALPSPTTEVEAIATATPFESAIASPSPSPLPPTAPPLQIVTPAPKATEAPASPTPPPTATSPFFEYIVQEGETLFYIIQLPQHGYAYEPNVAATVVALNDNIRDADSVIGGITILIPRPTATAAGAQATEALLDSIGLDDSSGAVLDSGAAVGCHNVVAGDSMVTIAHTYSTTLEILSDLNRGEVDWYGCNFKEPAGGPDCRPTLNIGQCVRVPLPTPLPTKIPTPTGDETATPTATKLAPRLLHPGDGDLIDPGPLTVHWVGLSGMDPGDEYLLELIDQTSNRSFRQVSRANSFVIPAAFIPADGQRHLVQWQVTVARKNDQGEYYYVGAPGSVNSFEWLSR